MTEKQLKKYPELKAQITYFERKIEKEQQIDISVSGKVVGSSKEFPYTEKRFSIEMNDPIEAEKSKHKIARWKQKIYKLEEETEKIEEFIDDIEDNMTRKIFELYFMKDMKQLLIAKKLQIDQSRVSRRIKEYLKTHI